MTRLPGRVGAGRAQHSSTRTKFRKHKVIMESVTQKRKKLRTIISFEPNAPPGYTFIPAGNPQFTIACKELCREQGLKVFTVTTTPHQNTHGLSQQVHRVGYHFPSTVVAKKCMELGLYLSENGNFMPFENFGTKLPRAKGEVEVSQITINTEARDVIRDLFPNIPDEDINQIIKTAFQKGQRKVGTATELPLARRAQLAVVAHIRHVYTDYDKLLKLTSFQEARCQVEDSTLERLVQWRGDDESGMPELEDVFREVIVISDDEEEEEEEDSDYHNRNDRELSVEILSTQVVSDKLDITGHHDVNFVSTFPVKVTGEPPSHEYNFMTGRKSQTFGKSKVDRRGFSRYQAWDRAMNRYREKKTLRYEGGLSQNSAVSRDEKILSSKPFHSRVSQASRRPLTPIMERIFDPPSKDTTYDVRPHSSDRFRHTSAHSLQDDNRTLLPGNEAPDILHFPDGSVFGKIPPVTSNKRSSRPVDVTSAPVFVAGPRLSETTNENSLKKRIYSSTHRPASNNQVDGSPRNSKIVPSIENRESPLPARFPAGQRINDSSLMPESIPGASTTHSRRSLDELSKGIDLIDLTEDTTEFPKRRRLESRDLAHDFHRSSLYKDDVSNSHHGKPGSQRALVVMHNRSFDPMPDGTRLNRLPIRRKDPVPYTMDGYTMDGSREETNHALYNPKDRSRDISGVVSAKPTVPLKPPETYNESGFSTTGRPRVDRLPQYRDPSFKADGYETDVPRVALFREDRPPTSHHSRGSGSDDAVWRNKANSYRSQRRLLEAQSPSWSISDSNTPFHGSRVQRPERATHSPALIQEDIMDPSPNFIIDVRAEHTPQHYEIQNRRVSSQPPLLDTQRKRDTLPASAMRRYEVQLEKSMNSRHYEPAPHHER